MYEHNTGDDSHPTVVVEAGDSTATEFGTTLLTTIADELDTRPASLPPLQESIDPDILNAFIDENGGTARALSFEYVGHEVVVTSDGAIWLQSLE